jgi:hypothetical protein
MHHRASVTIIKITHSQRMAICTLLADYINRVPEPLLELVDCSVDPPVAIKPSELLRIFMTAESLGGAPPEMEPPL